MNIVHLKYAVEIAKTKSISKAAENLYMGQPNLSRAIRELEDNLGITIFNRTSKGISITPDGEEFLQYARRIIAQVDEMEDLYQKGRSHKRRFSISVPRASYISAAFAAFTAQLGVKEPADIYYKETNSMRTINNVVREEFNLGIIRYQEGFEQYFKNQFEDKKLVSETIAEFAYCLLMHQDHPLAVREDIQPEELAPYFEICHADPYVPSLPLIDVKKAELSEFVDKRIYVYERASQFLLLEQMPNAFMWVSPVPDELLQKYHLIQKASAANQRIYKDVLVYRQGYKLTSLDYAFITALCEAKRKIISD
ncbi:MAG: LysR family transcriptional regulator [Clostridiales bacterium]|nr:MAG: LysR family transcriptional regulator [Clostridiales bacterium]